MRTAIFILGLFIYCGFELIANNNEKQPEIVISFLAIMFIVFVVMDLTEFFNQ